MSSSSNRPAATAAARNGALFNVNKRILEIDPQAASGRSRMEELLRAADICLLTPPASMAGACLDPLALRRDYPRLVVVAIRPFGGVGPRSAWKASDIELMAAGGAMALAGEPDGMPWRVSEPQSYGWAGAHAAIGALVALFRRRDANRPRRSRRCLCPGLRHRRAGRTRRRSSISSASSLLAPAPS